jgi:hypothetical protein
MRAPRLKSACLLLALAMGAAATETGVTLRERADRVRIEIDGRLFTEYVFRGTSRPFFHPLIGPGGARMTRDWPMKETPGEERDHPHHRSLWFSHGAVNGIDFWSELPGAGRIEHERFLEVRPGPTEGLLRSANRWVAPDGRIVCTDERLFRVHARPEHERLFDFEVSVRAPAGHDVVFGDTKEGTMAIRIAESMRLVRPAAGGATAPGAGRIVQSSGLRDHRCWGKPAEWCDYHGPVDGKVVGIAIFDHPSNPGHPTHWHVRDYGLFAANPFGLHDFRGGRAPAGAGELRIAAGKSVTFRYRFLLHEGDERQANVAGRYRKYAR